MSGQGGEACAMNNVAMCLERGMGVEPNIDAALNIYKDAAAGGSAQAAYSYGYLLLRRAVRLIVGEFTDFGNIHMKNRLNSAKQDARCTPIAPW